MRPAHHPSQDDQKLLVQGGEVLSRLESAIAGGSPGQVLGALMAVAELELAPQLRRAVLGCCSSGDAKVRSKAVLLLRGLLKGDDGPGAEVAVTLCTALGDPDPRVRANAIEAAAPEGLPELAEILEMRARHGQQRERANSVKALAVVRPREAESCLLEMLQDRRDPHRLSALWVAGGRGEAHLVEEVARIARNDINVRVRSTAATTLRIMLRRMLGAHRRGSTRAVA